MLLPHTKNIHGVDAKLKYPSVHNADIRGMFDLGSEPQFAKRAERRPSPAATGNTDILSTT